MFTVIAILLLVPTGIALAAEIWPEVLVDAALVTLSAGIAFLMYKRSKATPGK